MLNEEVAVSSESGGWWWVIFVLWTAFVLWSVLSCAVIQRPAWPCPSRPWSCWCPAGEQPALSGLLIPLSADSLVLPEGGGLGATCTPALGSSSSEERSGAEMKAAGTAGWPVMGGARVEAGQGSSEGKPQRPPPQTHEDGPVGLSAGQQGPGLQTC